MKNKIKMEKHPPERIIEILHSIKKLFVKDGELDTWFDDDQYASGIRSFIPDSFTRQLLELTEDHLLLKYKSIKHSPEEIIQILHSISKLSTSDGELDTWFTDSQYPMVPREFVPGSFTRELLDLIEDHLLSEEPNET